MKFKILALAASAGLLAAGAAHAQGYGTPPYGAYGYAGYDGGSCGGFTIAGAHAGVTVLGFDLGGGARLGFGGGECGGGGYAPPPPPVYQEQGYQGYPVQGGYYNQQAYAPVAYAPPAVYASPVYQQKYSYAPQPCGCQSYGYSPY